MIVGVEFDFVVKDSLKALELYEGIFEIERVEVSNFPRGQNEAVFTLYGVRFHMLDENPEFQLIAPTPESPKTSWMNIAVPDIKKTYEKAMELGCTEVQPVTELGRLRGVECHIYGSIWLCLDASSNT